MDNRYIIPENYYLCQNRLSEHMEKKYKGLLIGLAIILVISNLIIFYYFKIAGLDPSTTKLVLGVSIPVQIIAYGLVAWYFHKVSNK